MGYKEMPDAVKVPGLKPVTKLVLVTITGHANREKECTMWHSSSSIATEIGVSKRAVLDAYKTLEQRGLITRQERKHKTAAGTYHRGTDVITVHFDRIKASADARDDAKSEGGGNQSSPGVVTTGDQGGNESSAHNKELNQEPEQVKESFACNADASHEQEFDRDFKQRFKGSPDYAAILGMIAAAGEWKRRGEDDHYWAAHDQLFNSLEEVLGIPEHLRESWTISEFCADPYEAGMKFWKIIATTTADGDPPEWDGTNHGLKNPFSHNPRLKAAAV